MKIQKVVKIEVTSDSQGDTEVNIIFGLKGTRQNPWVHPAHPQPIPRFTETNRISLGWHEGYDLRHFDGWELPAPRLHPTDDLIKVVTEACRHVAGWDTQEQALPGYVPAQGSFQSQWGF